MPSMKPEILDCTLRDGNYAVDFQFTSEDVFLITRGLVDCGIRYIEVGHGLGLNGSNVSQKAAETDDECIYVAANAAGDRAKIGCFYIPGIGNHEALENASRKGLGFVRIGVDVDEYSVAEHDIRFAKSLGLEVWVNLMKSYLVRPGEFGKIASMVQEYGADVISIVDSAGGFTPEDIERYVSEAISQIECPLAFHGHNNLCLAVANCLRFIEAGGSYIDGSLGGIGRSSGNAATEVLASIISRHSQYETAYNSTRLIEFADSVLNYCVSNQFRPRAIEYATGLSFFHSGFNRIAAEVSSEYNISMSSLLMALPVEARKRLDSTIARNSAKAASKLKRSRYISSGSFDDLHRGQPRTVSSLEEHLRVAYGKYAKERVLTVAISEAITQSYRVGLIRHGSSCIVVHIEVRSLDDYMSIRESLQDVCELWLVDIALWNTDRIMPSQNTYVYNDQEIVRQSVLDCVQVINKQPIYIHRDGAGSTPFINLPSVSFTDDIGSACLVIAGQSLLPLSPKEIDRMPADSSILVSDTGALSDKAFHCARERNIPIWRVDCGAALVGEAERMVSTRQRFQRGAQSTTISTGQTLVSGGVFGKKGDLIVDSCTKPRFIIGKADGKGGVTMADPEELDTFYNWLLSSWGL